MEKRPQKDARNFNSNIQRDSTRPMNKISVVALWRMAKINGLSTVNSMGGPPTSNEKNLAAIIADAAAASVPFSSTSAMEKHCSLRFIGWKYRCSTRAPILSWFRQRRTKACSNWTCFSVKDVFFRSLKVRSKIPTHPEFCTSCRYFYRAKRGLLVGFNRSMSVSLLHVGTWRPLLFCVFTGLNLSCR